MLVTPRGVITGGDATTQGGYNVGRVAFFDFDSVAAPGQNETAIVEPIAGRVEVADEEFVVTGTANANSGVNRVQLEVRDRDSGRYLQDDLTTWGSSNTINVNLASPGATVTTWSLPLTIWRATIGSSCWPRRMRTNGSSDATKASKKIETFGLADQPPGTDISGPSGGVIPTLELHDDGYGDRRLRCQRDQRVDP